VPVAEQPPKPGLDLEQGGREPSMLLGRVLPVVHASAALFGQGVHGFECVRGLERPADQGEDSEPVEGEGLFEPLVETGHRGLIHVRELLAQGLQVVDGLLVRGPLVGALTDP